MKLLIVVQSIDSWLSNGQEIKPDMEKVVDWPFPMLPRIKDEFEIKPFFKDHPNYGLFEKDADGIPIDYIVSSFSWVTFDDQFMPMMYVNDRSIEDTHYVPPK